jgi:hypothetical protein
MIPRYARVNRAACFSQEVVAALQTEGYTVLKSQKSAVASETTIEVEAIDASASVPESPEIDKMLVRWDEHVPDLLVFAPGTDLHDHSLVQNGMLRDAT